MTVASLAIDPFVQQVASYRLNILTTHEPTSLPVRLGFKDNYGAYQAATYAALYNFGTVTQTSQNCFGNCTWGPYTTLAVCSQCAKISHLVSSSKPISTCRPSNKPTDSECLWTLPNGLNLSFGHSVGDTISSGEFPAITFHNNDSAILNFTLLSQGSSNDVHSSNATECSLYWCVNTYTAALQNNIFSESLLASPNATIPPLDASRDAGYIIYNTTAPINVTHKMYLDGTDPGYFTWPDYESNDTEINLKIVVDPRSEVSPWLAQLVSGNVTGAELRPKVIKLLGTEQYLASIFDRLAKYLTVAFRRIHGDEDNQFRDPQIAWILGNDMYSDTTVDVRWAWMTLPCVLLGASMLFMWLTIVEAAEGKAGIWKSNSLALLFHGLGSRHEEGIGHVVEMEKRAEKRWIQLENEGESEWGGLVEHTRQE